MHADVHADVESAMGRQWEAPFSGLRRLGLGGLTRARMGRRQRRRGHLVRLGQGGFGGALAERRNGFES